MIFKRGDQKDCCSTFAKTLDAQQTPRQREQQIKVKKLIREELPNMKVQVCQISVNWSAPFRYAGLLTLRAAEKQSSADFFQCSCGYFFV